MKLKKSGMLLTVCFLLVFVGVAFGESIPGETKDNLPFPSYGNGKVIVRIYSDYFCPPCRAAEPELEPLLIDLVKSKKITVIFVDTPIYKDSQVYAKYFLYALNKTNELEHAIRARSVLFEAAANKVNKDSLEEFLNGKGIAFNFFDTTPVLKRLNALLQDDRIDATPSCVIVKDGKPEKKVGGGEILKAIKAIQ